MDEKIHTANVSEEKIASFDSTYTSDHIRMLKILTHYLPVRYCRYLVIYIKFLELQQILSSPRPLHIADIGQSIQDLHIFKDPSQLTALLQELTPYCTHSERQTFEQMAGFLNTFEQLKNMMDMFEMMDGFKDMFQNEDGTFDPEMLAGMMGNMTDFSFFNNNP